MAHGCAQRDIAWRSKGVARRKRLTGIRCQRRRFTIGSCGSGR